MNKMKEAIRKEIEKLPQKRDIFATRSPRRPNPICLSVVKLVTKTLSVFIALLFTMSLFLIGCSSINSMSLNCDDLRQQKNISKQIEVNIGDTFTVNLCSNASTGFRWLDSANISDKTIVQQIDHKNVAPSKAMPGAPGQQAWTFEALKKGTAQITNEYSQPWSGGQKSAWNLILNVMVK
jgi:predicted secreted protein